MGLCAWLCHRFDHKIRTRYQSAYAWPSESSLSVVDKVEFRQAFCVRCGKTLGEEQRARKGSLTSLSMPESMWDRLRDTGRLVRRTWWTRDQEDE